MIEFRGKTNDLEAAIALIASASMIIGIYEFLFFFKKLTTSSDTPPI